MADLHAAGEGFEPGAEPLLHDLRTVEGDVPAVRKPLQHRLGQDSLASSQIDDSESLVRVGRDQAAHRVDLLVARGHEDVPQIREPRSVIFRPTCTLLVARPIVAGFQERPLPSRKS